MKYKSLFFSPRRFANEGTYIYGTAKEVKQFEETITGWENIGWWDEKNHRNEHTAQQRCEKDAKRDIRNTPQSEICCISSGHISEMI